MADGATEDDAWLELDGFRLEIWPDDMQRKVFDERLRISSQ